VQSYGWGRGLPRLPGGEVLLGLLGTALAFIMAVVALSFPEPVILRRVLRVPLIVAFVGVVTLGILLVGYVFNFLLHQLGPRVVADPPRVGLPIHCFPQHVDRHDAALTRQFTSRGQGDTGHRPRLLLPSRDTALPGIASGKDAEILAPSAAIRLRPPAVHREDDAGYVTAELRAKEQAGVANVR
jgi:hypothetical protein